MKRCSQCGDVKDSLEFSKDKQNKDGLRSWCKSCVKQYMKSYYEENKEYHKHRVKEYRQTEAGKAVLAAAKKKYRKTEAGKAADAKKDKKRRIKYPKRYKARKAINNAIAARKISRQPCEKCGSEPAEAHHDDYGKPLDVRWLCPYHHREYHKSEFSICKE